MLGYLLRRLGVSVIVLFGLSLLAFGIVRLVPGDTVTAMLGAHYSEAEAEALRERYGLDQPLVVQYGLWLGQVMQGDLGQSISGRPVSRELAQALPVTLELVTVAMGFAIVFGMGLGLLAAARQNGIADYLASVIAALGVSIPGFWLGAMLILLLSLQLGWLPSGTFVPLAEDPLANVRHMIMPGLALGMAVAAVIMRMTRTTMIEVARQDYMRTATAKGLPRSTVWFKHGLRNAAMPVLTIIGIQCGYLLGGSVVIEEVFSLNGIGRLMLRAIGDRDYPLLQAGILLIGGGFLFISLAVDLFCAALDPRIRH
jgi:peptide/nickel transport system permease protein